MAQTAAKAMIAASLLVAAIPTPSHSPNSGINYLAELARDNQRARSEWEPKLASALRDGRSR
jgi:hypothetical protein